MSIKVIVQIGNNSKSLCVSKKVDIRGLLDITVSEEEAIEQLRLAWHRAVEPVQRGLGYYKPQDDDFDEDFEDSDGEALF